MCAQAENRVFLGLVDEPVADYNTSWDSNKIGGEPNWIENRSSCPVCGVCGRTLTMVSQLYCPLAGSPYHRTLYLWACLNKSCWNQSHSWCLLRSQMLDTSVKPDSISKTHQDSFLPDDDWGDADADDWGDTENDVTMASTSSTSDKWCAHGNAWECKDTLSENSAIVSMVTSDSTVTMVSTDCVPPLKDSFIPVDENNIIDEDSLNLGQLNINDIEEDATQESDIEVVGQCVAEDVGVQSNSLEMAALLQIGQSSKELEESELPLTDICFVPYFLAVIDEPPEEDSENGLSHEHKLLAEYSQKEGISVDMLVSGDTLEDQPKQKKVSHRKRVEQVVMGAQGSGESYEKAVAQHGDRVMQKFLKQVARCPQQVLRYHWNGTPLNMTPTHSTPIPPCQYCNGPRVFELQLMPTLVSVLKPDKHPGGSAVLEFGTVLVYSCAASCWADGEVTRQEHVILQADPDHHLFR